MGTVRIVGSSSATSAADRSISTSRAIRRPGRHRARVASPGRDFTLLCAGQAVSQLGSRGYGLAITLWTLASTDSLAVVGLVSTMTLAVAVLARLPAGWIVDRFDRRGVMIVCDVASALAVGSLALLPFWLPQVLGVAGVLAAGWAIRGSAESAAVPNLVPDVALPRAIAMLTGRGYLTGIVGPVVSGALFALGPRWPFAVDALSYLVAGLCVSMVRRPLRRTSPGRAVRIATAAGLMAVWRHRYLRASALVATVTGFAVGCSGFLLVVVLERDGVDPATLGVAFAVTYAGGLGGTALGQVLGRRWAAHRVVMGGLTSGAVAALLHLPATGVAVCLGCTLLLLSHPLWSNPLAVDWARLVPDEIRGRADTAVGLAVAVPSAIAPVAVGWMVETLPTAAVGAWITVLMGTAVLTARFSLRAGAINSVSKVGG
jgi:MFS family permease